MDFMKLLVLLLIGFACGCGRSRSNESDEEVRLEQPGILVGHDAELASRVQTVTNLVQVNPILARSKGVEMRDWICKLEHSSEQLKAIDLMENAILAVDMRQWPEADRERGVNAIFDLEMEVVNVLAMIRASPTRIWQARFNVLRRIRREMDYAHEEAQKNGVSEADKIRLSNVARFIDANYRTWLKMFEYDFVKNCLKELPPDTWEDVRKTFEGTIGRPLRTAAELSKDEQNGNDNRKSENHKSRSGEIDVPVDI